MNARPMNQFQYRAADYTPMVYPGAIRSNTINGIVQTWAVSRPSAAPTPKYSPPAPINRGSGVGFFPAQPNVEMDPSNQQTWQRPYRFTT